MKNKKRKIILLVSIITVIAIGAGIFYRPVPVLDLDRIDFEAFRKEYPGLHVIVALYHSDEYPAPRIEDPDVEEAIISYLSTCKMRRTLFKKNSWYDMEFVIHGLPYTSLHIAPNGENRVSSGNGNDNNYKLYKLLNPDEVLEKLREIAKQYFEEE